MGKSGSLTTHFSCKPRGTGTLNLVLASLFIASCDAEDLAPDGGDACQEYFYGKPAPVEFVRTVERSPQVERYSYRIRDLPAVCYVEMEGGLPVKLEMIGAAVPLLEEHGFGVICDIAGETRGTLQLSCKSQ